MLNSGLVGRVHFYVFQESEDRGQSNYRSCRALYLLIPDICPLIPERHKSVSTLQKLVYSRIFLGHRSDSFARREIRPIEYRNLPYQRYGQADKADKTGHLIFFNSLYVSLLDRSDALQELSKR